MTLLLVYFVIAGYVGDDEANADTLNSEGWLRTGDLGFIDSGGFLFIVDRLKDVIKCYTTKVVYTISKYKLVWYLYCIVFSCEMTRG